MKIDRESCCLENVTVMIMVALGEVDKTAKSAPQRPTSTRTSMFATKTQLCKNISSPTPTSTSCRIKQLALTPGAIKIRSLPGRQFGKMYNMRVLLGSCTPTLSNQQTIHGPASCMVPIHARREMRHLSHKPAQPSLGHEMAACE